MNTYSRFAVAAIVAVIAIGGALYLVGPRLGVGPSPTPSATPTATGQVSAGRVTLTDTGCTWESNPGTLPTSVSHLKFELRNETDDFALFGLHWVRPGHTWEEGVALVAEIQRAIIEKRDWPPNEMSIAVADVGLEARKTDEIRWGGWAFEPGYYGVICAANTSATGDVLTTFLVGPLQLIGPSPKSS